MLKRKAFLLISCFIVFFSTATVFADPIIAPRTYGTTDTLEIGEGNIEGVDITLDTSNLSALLITDNANISIHNDIGIVDIDTSANNLTNLSIIKIMGTRTGSNPYSVPSLVVNSAADVADALVFNIDGGSPISVIYTSQNGTFTSNRALEIAYSGYGTAIDVNGITNLSQVATGTPVESANFKENVKITFDDTVTGLKRGLSMTNISKVTFEKDLEIIITDDNTATQQSDSTVLAGIYMSGSEGSSLTVDGKTTINVESNNAYGMRFYMKDGVATFNDDVDITIKGQGVSGLLAISSKVDIIMEKNLKVSTSETATTNDDAISIRSCLNDNLPTLIVKGNTTVITTGTNSRGIFVQRSNIKLLGTVDVTTEATGSHAIYFDKSTTVLGDTKIVTKANNANGLRLSGNGDPNNLVEPGDYTFGALDIKVEGNNTIGIYIAAASNMVVKGTAEIHSTDTGSPAITNYDSFITFEKSANISTQKDFSFGLNMNNTGAILPVVKFLDGGSITTYGNNAYPIRYNGGDGGSIFHNMIITASNNGTAVAINNNGNYDLELSFTGSSEIYGNVLVKYDANQPKQGTVTLKLSGTSFFRGGSTNTVSQVGAEVNLFLSGSTYWDISGAYRLDHVDMAGNTKIVFSQNTPGVYHKAKIAKLSGNGTIELSVDMSTAQGMGNSLEIGEADGSFELVISDSGAGGNGVARRLTIVEVSDVSNNPEFFMASTQEIVLGGKVYFLESNNGVWELVKYVAPEEVRRAAGMSVLGLFEYAKAIDALISDEIISTKKAVWVTGNYINQKFRGLSTGYDMKQNIFSILAGMEVLNYDKWDIGFLLGVSAGYQNVDDLIVGNTLSITGGIDAKYSHNGMFVSGYIRVAEYMHGIEMKDDKDLMQGRINIFGISASVQITKDFYISNTGIFVAPKAKISFTHLFEGNHDFDFMLLNTKNYSSLVLWAGGRIGYDLAIKDIPAVAYVELGIIYDTNPKIMAIAENTQENVVIDGKRFEFGFGADYDLNESTSFAFEYKFAISENLVEPIKLKLSMNTTF